MSPALASMVLAALFATLVTQSVGATPDTPLLEAANRAQPAVVETLKSLVAIETGSRDVAGLARLADVLEERLKALGFSTERRKTAAGAGADMVIGRLKGSGGANIMMQAHMDTVYESGVLQSQPIHQDGNRLYGPGIADDKGGITLILHSLQILRDAGWKDFGTITVMLNPDEEVGSVGSGETISALAD